MIDDSAPNIVLIENLLSIEECQDLIKKIDESDPSIAPINKRINTEVRNNERSLFKNHELAAKIFYRAKHKLPRSIFSHELIGLNELFRGYRYKADMKFARHKDGAHKRYNEERSFYSFLIYLNDVEEGGNTNLFVDPEVSVVPEPGLGLIFQHPITHEGATVEKGVKYVLRTDVMYRP